MASSFSSLPPELLHKIISHLGEECYEPAGIDGVDFMVAQLLRAACVDTSMRRAVKETMHDLSKTFDGSKRFTGVTASLCPQRVDALVQSPSKGTIKELKALLVMANGALYWKHERAKKGELVDAVQKLFESMPVMVPGRLALWAIRERQVWYRCRRPEYAQLSMDPSVVAALENLSWAVVARELCAQPVFPTGPRDFPNRVPPFVKVLRQKYGTTAGLLHAYAVEYAEMRCMGIPECNIRFTAYHNVL